MVTGQCELVLDIGTHKVLALAARPTETGVEVLASSFVRHEARAMRDGQVHDVAAVSRTVRQAVDHVSTTVGVKFSGAHIAAAGRALKTSRGGAERAHTHSLFMDTDSQRAMEWEAVADAQWQLLDTLAWQDQAKGFYCIAHNVVDSRLDGEAIASLTGQRGRLFSIEVLATFLPGVVVDSLEAVLAEAGLAMYGLTLEPIAALEAVVSATMRHLRLILVDIGAGTSDIALTGDGVVQAFAMVPRGGDAITEIVSQTFLLDFHVAERVKRTVSAGSPATVENVLGDRVTVAPPDLHAAIDETTYRLADEIATALSEWTFDTSPAAVLLVGGGSNTPGLSGALAERIGLDASRIAVRDRGAVRGVVGEEQLAGPDAVTALGIALRAARGKEMPPVRVRINDRPVSLFQPDRCTVREAARIAGMPLAQLIGRPGPGITVTLNGTVVALPGHRGEAASVHVNGTAAELDTVLSNQDEVTLQLPAAGAAPRLTMTDVVTLWEGRPSRAPSGGVDAGSNGQSAADHSRPRIRLNGNRLPVPLWLHRNGARAHPDDVIADRDVINIRFVQTAGELITVLNDMGPSAISDASRDADASDALPGAVPAAVPTGSCTVNGESVDLSQFATLFRNGAPARWSDPVLDGDEWEYRYQEPVTVRHVVERSSVDLHRSTTIVLNGERTTIPVSADIRLNGAPASANTPVADGDVITVQTPDDVALYHVLPYAGVSVDGSPSNGRLVLLVRGTRAGFTTTVSDGDEVVIRYESNPDQESTGS